MPLKEKIKAVAFDIDGTLYPEWIFALRIVPTLLTNWNFFWQYRKVRKIMHRTGPLPDFFEYQGRILAELLHCSVEDAKQKILDLIYEGFKKHFKKIDLFPGVEDLFVSLKKEGIKIALLSDFKPEQKGDIWGLKDYCDVIMSTEVIGALKPSKLPFGLMTRELGVKPDEILYVGNSEKYDVVGSKEAGLLAAYKKGRFAKKSKLADINFSNYKDLKKIILG